MAVQVCLVMLVVAGTMGASKPVRKSRKAAAPKPKPDVSSICIEAGTGLVIMEENADKQRPPASMVKMIQLLLVSEGLKAGKWTLETRIKVTPKAAAIGGTGIGLKETEEFPLGRMMQAVAVCSANDAAMAVAETLWGDEKTYLETANKRALELDMKNTKFNSVHGLPPVPGGEFDASTARDMARLAQFCVLDPAILGWTSQKELQFRPADPVRKNTNRLLETMAECDGLKTGFINSAGFCLTATAVRDGIRLISVVMGTTSNSNRFAESQKALEAAFGQVTKKRVVAKGAPVGDPVPVANCETPAISLTAADDLWVVVKQDDADKLEVAPQYPALIQAPLAAGAPVGRLNVQLAGKLLGTVALTAPVTLKEADLRWKLLNSLAMPRK
ncbi:MAG: D-alanyl-D-alanine carboxypeptidase [Candidatus Hydrogenedentes bacterium]|nr:D-alanyl-D-alanine carboxypeptidase [Candidatus Hydrogenedentota bacterium]